jgi:predicted small secreted protein
MVYINILTAGKTAKEFQMKKEKILILGLLAMLLALSFVLSGCATAEASVAEVPAAKVATGTSGGETDNGGNDFSPKKLDALLNGVSPVTEKWGSSEYSVYYLNPEIKDELIQAVKEAGYYLMYSGKMSKGSASTNGVLQWGVQSNGIQHQVRIFPSGDENFYFWDYRLAPASGGVPKTIKITGYNLDVEKVDALRIRSESEGPYNGNGMPTAVAGIVEADGQTLTLMSFAGLSFWEGGREFWMGTGTVFLVLQNSEPRDKTKKTAFYTYSADGTNPTAVDIKDEVTTLEWSKFIWVRDQ